MLRRSQWDMSLRQLIGDLTKFLIWGEEGKTLGSWFRILESKNERVKGRVWMFTAFVLGQ